MPAVRLHDARAAGLMVLARRAPRNFVPIKRLYDRLRVDFGRAA